MQRKIMQAVFAKGNGQVEIRETSVPNPLSGEVLVKVVAAALNPTDWKTLYNYIPHDAAIIGCDFSGIIVEVGYDVGPEDAICGQRVAGFVHGGIRENGSFSEFLISSAQTLIKIPENWSFEEAAQLGIACFTACQCLYQSHSLPTPLDSVSVDEDILVWSGTSSVGYFALQLAKLVGMRVISTASPKNFSLLNSLGVDNIFDYNDSKAGQMIRSITNGNLIRAVDCISEKTTPFQVSNALSLEGGVIAATLPYKSRKPGVEVVYSLAYTLLGDAFDFPQKYEPLPEYTELGKQFAKIITALLKAEKLVPAPIRIFPRGLAGVQQGLQYMKDGKVSAEKLVYRIADTPNLPM